MLQSYCVNVPCKGYIKKYFTRLYGHPIPLNHKSDFGDTILTKMISPSLAQANGYVLNLSNRDYNDQVKFQLSFDFFYRVENNLKQQQVYNINRFLENTFKADLFIFVNCAAFFGVERKISIERFADKYEIQLEEDIKYDALVKAEMRYRKTLSARNNLLLQLSTALTGKLTA
jgi:hypothetical protein